MATLQFSAATDRPTPDPGQLFAVGVSAFGHMENEDHKYYVPGGGLVLGTRQKSMYNTTAGGAKRRAKMNPVYNVTGCSMSAQRLLMPNNINDLESNKTYENIRVFGVAFDGIDAGNMRNAKNHPDSCGRFSVIFDGTTTISAPHTVSSHDHLGYATHKKANGTPAPVTVGDLVFANPFANGRDVEYNFRGDPDRFHPIALGYVKRETYTKMFGNPSQDNVDNCAKECFGTALNGLAKKTKFRVLHALMVGYVLDTGSAKENEIRVQININAETRPSDGPTVILSSFLDDDSSATPLEAAMLDCIESVPTPVDSDEGCPVGSLLGVVGKAATPSGTVGTVDYSTMSAKEAGSVVAQMSRPQMGLSHGLDAKAGTIAGEILQAGMIDPASTTKLAARQELVHALSSHSTPATVASFPANDIMVPVTPSMQASLGECPSAVLESHAITNVDGSAMAPHPMWVKGLAGGTEFVTSATTGSSLDIYQGNAKAKSFVPKVQALLKTANAKGVPIHLADPSKLQNFVELCQNELH